MPEREPLGWLGTYSAVLIGAFAAIGTYGFLELITNGDTDPNTYRPSDLNVVEFSPEPDVDCRGLSTSGAEQVLANTIVCDWSSVEANQP